MRRWMVFAVFLAVVLIAGGLIGSVTRPDGWYAALAKPSFNPPNWIFAPVWTALYILIAIAGARTYLDGDRPALALWASQMLLNFAWTPAFFGLHRPALALGVIAIMLALIVAFIVVRWPRDRVGAALFVPYALWVAFASLLNAAIVALN
jgi:tryptophan-rich sensory protein